MALSFDVTAADSAIIQKIVQRGLALDVAHGARHDKMGATMDITATHASGCALRLQDMLDADDFNFGHDWWGIRRHIDRTTGQMTDCFWPRFAKPGAEQAAA